MTSKYTSFADRKSVLIKTRWNLGNNAGEGMAWGHEGHTLREAAADAGADILCEMHGGLLCELSDRLYLLLDCNGPWAVEVADQRDLPDDLMSDECELGNAW